MPSAGVELPACSCRLFGKNLFPLTTIPSFLSFQGLRCQLQPPSTASSPLVSLGSSSQACVRLQALPCASDLGLSSRGGRRPLGFWGQRGLWGFFALAELPLPPYPDPGAAQALQKRLRKKHRDGMREEKTRKEEGATCPVTKERHQSRPCGESRLSHTLSKKAPSPCGISRGYVGSDNKHSHPSQPECYQQKLSRGPEHPLLLRSDEEPLPYLDINKTKKWGTYTSTPTGRKEAVLCTSAAMLAETEGLNSFQGLTT